MKRVIVCYAAALVLPFVAAGVTYPIVGEAGASLISVLLSWSLLWLGSRGVSLGIRQKGDYLKGLLTGLALRMVLILAVFAGAPLTGSSHAGMALVVLCISALGAAWFEERFFRGALLESLEDNMGRAGSAVISSTMFALLHYPLSSTSVPWTQLAFLTLFGLTLCFLKWRFESFYIVLTAHLVFNITGLLLMVAGP